MTTQLHPMRPERASRTLTFLFTDIEGSTRLWEQHQQAMKQALERHDAILRGAVEGSRGQVVKTIGDGFHGGFRLGGRRRVRVPESTAGPLAQAAEARRSAGVAHLSV